MERLGILHTGKIEKPRVHSIAALWTFDKNAPHIITNAHIQKQGSAERVEVSALWDTGASICALSKEAAYEISLKPTGKTQCEVAGGKTLDVETVYIDFFLPDGTTVKTEASIIDMPNSAYNFIVGMSVILHGDFLIKKTQDGFDFLFKIPQ